MNTHPNPVLLLCTESNRGSSSSERDGRVSVDCWSVGLLRRIPAPARTARWPAEVDSRARISSRWRETCRQEIK